MSRTMEPHALRIPRRRERPKFTPDVPLLVQAHVWLTWLRKTSEEQIARTPDNPKVYLSAAGAKDLSELIERMARSLPYDVAPSANG